jgi:CheY-like chemotaxis protein
MESTGRILFKKLFIIDDDGEDQEIFMEALKEVDPEIVCYSASSGDDAMRKLKEEMLFYPDLIFLDMNMPKLNGKQVLKELKDVSALRRIPVIMYSTSFAPRDIEEIEKLGAVHHLLKPARFDELCDALVRVLSVDWDQQDGN